MNLHDPMLRALWIAFALWAGCGGNTASTDGGLVAADPASDAATEGDAAQLGDAASTGDAAGVDGAHANPDSGSAPSSSGGGPTVVQSAVHQSPSAPPPYTATAPFENDSTVELSKATKKGDAIWVVATVSDYGGVHSVSVSDTQHNTFTQLDQENDGQPGAQTVVHFWAKNIAGDASSPDVIRVSWGSDNYKGVVAVELAGVTGVEGHSGVIQDSLAKGMGNVRSGDIDVSAVPALLVALSMSTDGGASDTGGNGCGGPSAGSGFASVASIWSWSTATLATVESEALAKTGTVNATYSAPCAGPYVTVAAVFH